MNDFGETLRNARVRKSILQNELADKIGCAPTQLSHWELNERRPNLTNFVRICIALETSSDELLGLKSPYNVSLEKLEIRVEKIEKIMRDMTDDGNNNVPCYF